MESSFQQSQDPSPVEIPGQGLGTHITKINATIMEKNLMLNIRKSEKQKLSFPEVWHFQSPHIITTLNSETPKQETSEVPSVSLMRRTAEVPSCCLEEGWQKSQEPWPRS